MASITWSIRDESTVQQIKSANVGRCFQSQTITAFGHQWYLELYPNGSGQDRLGETELFLEVAVLSPKVKDLKLRYKLCLRANSKEQTLPTTLKRLLNSVLHTECTLTHEKMVTQTWLDGSVKLSDIQKLDRLTFTVDFDLIGARDQNDQSILGKFKDNGAEQITRAIRGVDVFPAIVTWCIVDESLLQQIKSAKVRSYFFTPTFEVFGHKWLLEFFPNGQDEKASGSPLIFLYTPSLSPKIKAMRVSRKLTFVEGDVSHVSDSTLTPEKTWVSSWGPDAASFKTCDLAKHNHLTFRVEIDLYGVFDEHGNDILSRFKDDDEKQLNVSVVNVHQPKASYTWSITDQPLLKQIKAAKAGQRFVSPKFTAFANEWYLRLCPNGINAKSEGDLALSLRAAALSPKIKSIRIRCTLRFPEANINCSYDRSVDRESMHKGHSWLRGAVKLSDILDMHQLTFTVDLDVLGAVDHDGNDMSANLFAIEQQSRRKERELQLITAQKEQKAKVEVERDIPESFLCPLTHRVMRDPVIAFDGRSYEREAIEEFLKKHNKSPVTGAEAITSMVFSNHDLHSRIITFIEAQEMASEEQQSKEGEGETALE